MSTPCDHMGQIEFTVHVHHYEDCESMGLDLRARCTGCGAVMRFLGVPKGAGGGAPTSSCWGDQVSLPCVVDLPAACWDMDGGVLPPHDRLQIQWAMDRDLKVPPALVLTESSDLEDDEVPS